MTKGKTIGNPWDFDPSDTDSRYNFPIGAGSDYGKGIKARIGRIRQNSVVGPPKDKTSGFKKPITEG